MAFFFRMLRTGFTTGACAAAAGKAAAVMLLQKKAVSVVSIPFPDGLRAEFAVNSIDFTDDSKTAVRASIKKDAGDDPDVTNGILIEAEVSRIACGDSQVKIQGGIGVGLVTKPGLAVEVGKHAINPGPVKMITAAVEEAMAECGCQGGLAVTVSVPEGERVAAKTFNQRLGIVGGISILGTTGVVKPVSAGAWQATIKTSMKVAQEGGLKTIVVSTGRTSESAAQAIFDYPPESYIMMGDFLEFTFTSAASFSFDKIIYSGMWGKILKGAMGWSNTHVRNSFLTTEEIILFMEKQGVDKHVTEKLKGSNSAREIFGRLLDMNGENIILMVCEIAKKRFEKWSNAPVEIYLIGPDKQVIINCN